MTERISRQLHLAGFAGFEFDGYRYFLAFYLIVQIAAGFSVARVFQFGTYVQDSRGLVGDIGPALAWYFRYDMRIFYPDGACMFDGDLIPDTGVAVADRLDPVPAGYILM